MENTDSLAEMLARSNRIAALPDLHAMLAETLAYAIELCAAKGGRLRLERNHPGAETVIITQGKTGGNDRSVAYPLRLSGERPAWVEMVGASNPDQVLQTFLDRMASEIEKSIFLLEQQQRLSLQEDLIACLPQFSASLDQEQILHTLVQSARRLLPADAILLYLSDAVTGELTLHLTSPEDLVDLSGLIHMPPGAGIIGQAVENRQTYIVTKTASGPQTGRASGWYNGLEPSSILAVPLQAGPAAGYDPGEQDAYRIIGGLEALNIQGGPFDEASAHRIQTLAGHAAIAYENAGQDAGNRRLFLEVIRSLAAAIDNKEPYTEGHSQRVSDYAIAIATRLGFDSNSFHELRIASLLHDIGKIGIPDRILTNSGTLSEAEYKQMQQHPAIGARLLSQAGASTAVLEVILQHHERLDGSGYPAGLKAGQVSLWSQIVAVADVFDAMVSDRPYRKGLAVDIVQDDLKSQAGKQFEPRCVEALIAACQEGEISIPMVKEDVEPYSLKL